MIFKDPSFWVLVGFLILILLLGKGLWTKVTHTLDERSRKIAEEIEEAARVREEALSLLETCKQHRRDASEQAQNLLAHAEEEAERLRQKSLQEMDAFMKAEEKLFQERLSQAEARALDDIRNHAILVAGDAARRALQGDTSSKSRTKDPLNTFIETLETLKTAP